MLCINKRLYRPGRLSRSHGSDRPGRLSRTHRSDRSHRSNGSDRTGGPGSAVPVSIFYAAAGGNHRNGSDP